MERISNPPIFDGLTDSSPSAFRVEYWRVDPAAIAEIHANWRESVGWGYGQAECKHLDLIHVATAFPDYIEAHTKHVILNGTMHKCLTFYPERWPSVIVSG